MQLLGRKAIGRTRCPDARALLPSYVEGELSANDRERIAGHLHICSECRAEENRFRASLGALAGFEPMTAPRNLYAGFAARLDATERIFRRRAMRLRFAGGAACLLLVTTVGARPLIQGLFNPKQPESIEIIKPVTNPSAIITFNHPEPNVARKPDPPIIADNSDNTAIVQPESITMEPAPRRARQNRPPQVESIAAVNFLDVKPKVGPSARDQIASAEPGRNDGGSDAVPVRPERSAAVKIDGAYISERNERIKVGDTLTTVKTGYQLDENGRRTVVNVNIGTNIIP